MREVIESDMTILEGYDANTIFMKNSIVGAGLRFTYRLILLTSLLHFIFVELNLFCFAKQSVARDRGVSQLD